MQDTNDYDPQIQDRIPPYKPQLDLSDLGGAHGFQRLDPALAQDWKVQTELVAAAHSRWLPYDLAMRLAQDALDDARNNDQTDMIPTREAASQLAFEERQAEKSKLDAVIRRFKFDTYEEWCASRIEFARIHPGALS